MISTHFVAALAPVAGYRLLAPRLVPAALPRAQLMSARPVSRPSYSDLATQRPATSGGERIYTDFHVYKTRAAMTLRLLPPAFIERMDGSKNVERAGTMLLEFANANPGQPGGSAQQSPAGGINRTYNWGSKVVFALSPVELGSIVAEQGFLSEKGLTMFHDPAKLGKSGEPVKRLTLKTLPDGAISFGIAAGPDMISVPVSRGEFEVIKSVAQFAIPRLLGFDALFSA